MGIIFIFVYIIYAVLNYIDILDSHQFSIDNMILFFMIAIISSIIMFITEGKFKNFLHKIYSTITGGIIAGILIIIIAEGEFRFLSEAIINISSRNDTSNPSIFILLFSIIGFIIIILMIFLVPLLYTYIISLMIMRSKKSFEDCEQRKQREEMKY